jgi:hypothetical protein
LSDVDLLEDFFLVFPELKLADCATFIKMTIPKKVEAIFMVFLMMSIGISQI